MSHRSMKLVETAIQLQILSERATYIFDVILRLATSLDERIESLTRKIGKSNEVENYAVLQQGSNVSVTTSSDRSNPQFLIPATRDERYHSKHRRIRCHNMWLHSIDKFQCSERFST